MINWLIMIINGTDFINHPWNTTFGAYTDLFSAGFYLIPISFIAIALYVKTHNPVLVSSFIWASGLLLAGGSIFTGYPEMAFVFFIFTVMGIAGVIISLYFMNK